MRRPSSTSRKNRRRRGPEHISVLMQVILARYNIDIDLEADEEQPLQMTLFDDEPQDASRELVAHY